MSKPSFKDKVKNYVGYDPVVLDAASTTNAVKGATSDLPGASLRYIDSLFPFTKWILNYNVKWLTGDLIAGITVGMVVVPQSMSYAKIATLAPEYGLYSSFVGVCIYALFATSKDITIGPVAVMSLQVARVIQHVMERTDEFTAPVIASALALICGCICLGIGVLRLGWLVEFIPAPAVSGFMTGSAISIAAGQFSGMMGYNSKFDTRAATYKVIINSFKYLGSTKLDAAYGLSSLAFLYGVRAVCNHFQAKGRTPVIRQTAFFVSTLRTAFVIIVSTLAAYLHVRNISNPKNYPISILKTVPSGFQHMGVPVVNSSLLGHLAGQLPVSTIILLLEHIAISKSFGRVNNYKIDPNQELIAMGVTNVLTPFFGGYPATGSFSRTAIKSKAGVRTPIAGWITGIVVIIALFALTDAFYFIPNAALAAVIIHAVGDLIASPRQVFQYWATSPLEAIIWFGAVIITIFTTIEIGIYASVGASAALLLYRIAKPRGKFLGRVRVRLEPDETFDQNTSAQRDVYLPLTPDGVRNPHIRVEPPPPGVIIFKPEEAILYPNSARYYDQLSDYAKSHTRSGIDYSTWAQGDRPWNDPGPNRWQKKNLEAEAARQEIEASKPVLRAIVLDFSSVPQLDTTSVQSLVDLRRSLERYAGQPVAFHFAGILSPWIKRGLLAGGFGRDGQAQRPLEIAATVPSGAEPEAQTGYFQRNYGGASAGATATQSPVGAHSVSSVDNEKEKDLDLEESTHGIAEVGRTSGPVKSHVRKSWDADSLEGPVVSPVTTHFHLDLASAVDAAVGKGGNW